MVCYNSLSLSYNSNIIENIISFCKVVDCKTPASMEIISARYFWKILKRELHVVLIISQIKFTGNFPKRLGKNACEKFIEFTINENAFWNSPLRRNRWEQRGGNNNFRRNARRSYMLTLLALLNRD